MGSKGRLFRQENWRYSVKTILYHALAGDVKSNIIVHPFCCQNIAQHVCLRRAIVHRLMATFKSHAINFGPWGQLEAL